MKIKGNRDKVRKEIDSKTCIDICQYKAAYVECQFAKQESRSAAITRISLQAAFIRRHSSTNASSGKRVAGHIFTGRSKTKGSNPQMKADVNSWRLMRLYTTLALLSSSFRALWQAVNELGCAELAPAVAAEDKDTKEIQRQIAHL